MPCPPSKHRSSHFRVAFRGAFLSAMGGALLIFATGAEAADKYDLAAHITHLISKYSNWPDGPGDRGTVFFGVYGGGAGAGAFAALDGESLKGDRIRVVGVDAKTSPVELGRCAVIFTSNAADLKRVASSTTGQPVLLVHLGDGDGLACISLDESGGKLVFEVFMGPMVQRKLSMSSQALSLARRVHR